MRFTNCVLARLSHSKTNQQLVITSGYVTYRRDAFEKDENKSTIRWRLIAKNQDMEEKRSYAMRNSYSICTVCDRPSRIVRGAIFVLFPNLRNYFAEVSWYHRRFLAGLSHN
jgi:hypothetical protein